MAIDPGTQNLQFAVFSATGPNDIRLLCERTCSPGRSIPDVVGSAETARHMALEWTVDVVLIEDQPRVNKMNPAVVYWNGVVESALCTIMEMSGLDWRIISPSAAKRKAGICTGNYWANKEASLAFCNEKCANHPWLGSNHHISDCFLLAWYYFSTEKE